MPEWITLIVVALVAASGTWLTTRFGRMAKLESRIASLERTERRAWLYIRVLIDHIYKGRPAPPPDPPDDLFGEEEK